MNREKLREDMLYDKLINRIDIYDYTEDEIDRLLDYEIEQDVIDVDEKVCTYRSILKVKDKYFELIWVNSCCENLFETTPIEVSPSLDLNIMFEPVEN